MAGKKNTQTQPDAARASLISLPADCRLAAQLAVKDRCVEALATSGVLLDGSRVERIDTAALQVLMMFRRDMAAAGGSWSWQGVSAVLHEAASLLGLAQILEMPATVPA